MNPLNTTAHSEINANSNKKPENQPAVLQEIAGQLTAGERRIFGVMIESHIVAGSQQLVPGAPLTYGQSVTDGCIGWEQTVELLDLLADAVGERRSALAA